MNDVARSIGAARAEIDFFIGARELARGRFDGGFEAVFKRFFRFVACNVPAWQHVVWQGDVASTLEALPVLTRRQVAANPENFRQRNYGGSCVEKSTSGFTGAKLTVLYDEVARFLLNTSLYEAVLRKRSHALSGQLKPGKTLVGMVTNKPGKDAAKVLLPGASCTFWERFPLEDGVEGLISASPPIIYGKPYYLREMLDILEKRGGKLSPHCILTSGERLYADDLKSFAMYLKAPIVNALVTSESGVVALSDGDPEKLRVCADFVVVEVLKDSGEVASQGYGELVVTSAFNWINPMIRFRTGDKCLVKSDGAIKTIEKVQRRSERTCVGAASTSDLDLVISEFDIWDFRLRVSRECVCIVISNRLTKHVDTTLLGKKVAKLVGVERYRVRQVERVTPLGLKRLRYPC